MTCAPGLLCAEENVGNLKKTCTFRNSGTPVRRTKRQKSKNMHFQEFRDSCAQNKTSAISKTALSGILGFLCAEQNVGNLKKMHFQVFWDSCSQNKQSEISRTTLSGIMRLLCAEQGVGNLKKWIFRNSGTPVRRTRRRKSQKLQFQEFRDSCAQNWKTKISRTTLSGILRLLCAE